MRIIGPILLIIGIVMVVTAIAFCVYLAKMGQRALSSNDSANQPMNTGISSTTTTYNAGPGAVIHVSISSQQFYFTLDILYTLITP